MVVIMIGTEAEQGSLMDGLHRRFAFVTLGIQGEVDHHDCVLLYDAEKQNDADDADHPKILAATHS